MIAARALRILAWIAAGLTLSGADGSNGPHAASPSPPSAFASSSPVGADPGAIGATNFDGTPSSIPRWFALTIGVLTALGAAFWAVKRARRDPTSLALGTVDATDQVRLGVAAPGSVVPGERFVARFFAYAPGLWESVEKTLAGIAKDSAVHHDLKRVRWPTGTKVRVVCAGRGIEVTDPDETFEWNGEYEIVSFEATVPKGATHGRIPLGFDVYVAELRVAKLRIEVSVGASARFERHVEATPVTTAFASYSSKDRARVLDRIAALRAATGMDCFVDCLSLRPGERWWPEIHREILARQAFLLFWSESASGSEWVRREWQTCLAERGEDTIQVQPLESPDLAPPPKELSHFHFDDPIMRVRASLAEAKRAP